MSTPRTSVSNSGTTARTLPSNQIVHVLRQARGRGRRAMMIAIATGGFPWNARGRFARSDDRRCLIRSRTHVGPGPDELLDALPGFITRLIHEAPDFPRQVGRARVRGVAPFIRDCRDRDGQRGRHLPHG